MSEERVLVTETATDTIYLRVSLRCDHGLERDFRMVILKDVPLKDFSADHPAVRQAIDVIREQLVKTRSA